jgi:hypothetical protein
MSSGSSSGAATSGLCSLAAIFARVWRGNECGAEGVYIGVLAWTRGKRSIQIMKMFAVITPGTAPCLLRSPGRDDRWACPVSG